MAQSPLLQLLQFLDPRAVSPPRNSWLRPPFSRRTELRLLRGQDGTVLQEPPGLQQVVAAQVPPHIVPVPLPLRSSCFWAREKEVPVSIIWENYSCTDLTADIVPIAELVRPLPVVTAEELECQVRERVHVTVRE